jgi:hypothetical protein
LISDLVLSRFWLSYLYPLLYLLPDFDYHIYTLYFTCSQILTIIFIPFSLLAPRFWLSNMIAKIWYGYLCLREIDLSCNKLHYLGTLTLKIVLVCFRSTWRTHWLVCNNTGTILVYNNTGTILVYNNTGTILVCNNTDVILV